MRIKKYFFMSMLIVFSICTWPVLAQVKVTVDTGKPKWKISKDLVGIHMVYSFADDAIYSNGKIAKWAKETGVATSRYPGGTILKYWDWKKPTGVMEGDPWDPKWKIKDNKPANEWMSLDEYLKFVKKSGITRMALS